MHSSCTPRPMYTGAPMFAPHPGPMMGHHPHHDAHGFCHSCCHPRSQCQCHRRECRKESKELLVTPVATDAKKMDAIAEAPILKMMMKSDLAMARADATVGANIEKAPTVGMDTTFIGGGCCVHLSVEYAADSPTQAFGVGILVADSEGTLLLWGKGEKAGTPYQIKEGIITTKPGAKLTVLVVNATARVRWCEIFSC